MTEYIKKQDIIDKLMDYASRWFAYDPYNKIVAKIFQDIELTIKGIPSTDVIEPKCGEWILECDAEGEGDNLYRCSECGQGYGCQEYDIPNFCPNCGADMRDKD